MTASILSVEEMFSFSIDGSTTLFHIDCIKAWCTEALRRGEIEICQTEVDRDFAEFIAEHRGIDPDNLAALPDKALDGPIIYAQIGGKDLLIDGNHRYLAASRAGRTMIMCIALTEAQWRPFSETVED